MAPDRFDPQLRERFLACETVDDVIRAAKDADLHLDDGELISAAFEVQRSNKEAEE